MPVKFSFCCRRWTHSGAYETHLPKAHSDLDIILASTIGNPLPNCVTDPGTNLLDDKPSERPDSDYESDSANYPAGYERGTINDDPRHESHTKILTDNTPSAAAQQTYYHPAAREAIRDVEGYEEKHHNLYEYAWAPFTSTEEGSSLHLGSLRGNSRSCKSTITFGMASATRRQLSTAPCIVWKIISDPWIPMANIDGGSKDRFSVTSDRYHSLTVIS